MTIASCKVTTVGLLLFQLLSVVFCIPLDTRPETLSGTKFYQFGGIAYWESTYGVFGVRSSAKVPIDRSEDEMIQFYGDSQHTATVSNRGLV